LGSIVGLTEVAQALGLPTEDYFHAPQALHFLVEHGSESIFPKKGETMLDFLYAQSTYVAIFISGFLAIGFGLLLVYWRIKIIPLGPRPRKKAGIATAFVSIFVGLISIFLMVLTAFRFHAPLFHHWIFWFAVDVLIYTIILTYLGYRFASRSLKRIGVVVDPESWTQQREESAPPRQTARPGPQPKEAREEE
jgi:uncharacterized protein YacL